MHSYHLDGLMTENLNNRRHFGVAHVVPAFSALAGAVATDHRPPPTQSCLFYHPEISALIHFLSHSHQRPIGAAILSYLSPCNSLQVCLLFSDLFPLQAPSTQQPDNQPLLK